MSKATDREQILTTKQAAEFLHITENTLRKWVMKGIGPDFSRIGTGRGRILYRLPVLVRYLENNERGGKKNGQAL